MIGDSKEVKMKSTVVLSFMTIFLVKSEAQNLDQILVNKSACSDQQSCVLVTKCSLTCDKFKEKLHIIDKKVRFYMFI